MSDSTRQLPPLMLSKTAEYALRAVTCMAGQADLSMSANRLAEQTKVPRRYLHRVLQGLVAADLVLSQTGQKGGYRLAKAAGKITILDVVNAIDPIQRITKCPLGLAGHQSLCPLHAALDEAYAANEKAYKSVTIAAVVESTGSISPLCDAAVKTRRTK